MSRNYQFDYPHTCPDIDRVLADVVSNTTNEFDRLREINSNLRDAAEKQIKELGQEIEDLLEQVKNLEYENSQLKDQLEEVKQ